MNEHFFKLQGCLGERLSTKKKSEQKIQQQARLAGKNLTSDFTALYIVFETVEYQHIVFIISHCRL